NADTSLTLSSCIEFSHRPLSSTLFPYTTLFRSDELVGYDGVGRRRLDPQHPGCAQQSGGQRRWSRRRRAVFGGEADREQLAITGDRKSTRLNSSHVKISYAVFCLKKKTITSLPD